jgi:choline dehydrogenase-like flavoprotein
MFLDANAVPAGTVVETEICIVGAGAAGITLAREFIGAGFRTVLLESGSTDFDPDTQELYKGSDIGRRYEDLTTCRLRYFGGTTNHWGGWCRPLEPVDLEVRDGLPYRGWPFDRAHLDPWYRRAQEVVQLGPYEYSPEKWGISPASITPPFGGPHFVTKILQQSPPTRFGQVYQPELRAAGQVAVYLKANALSFETDPSGRSVEQVKVGTLAGNRFAVRAKIFVLACGGVENARLLLLSPGASGNGLGNEHDLVGRFFMVHIVYSGGSVLLSDPYVNLDFFTGRGSATYAGFGKPYQFVSLVGLSPESMRSLKLPNINVMWLYKFRGDATAFDALGRLTHFKEKDGAETWADLGAVFRNVDGIAEHYWRRAVHGQGLPVEALLLNFSSEQLPNPDSRITLGAELDALGQRRVTVDWRVTAEDRRLAFETQRLFGAEIGRAGLGRLQMSLRENEDSWPDGMYGDEHQMGTTRMHRDPTQGVVDENCRLHGAANVYVAGSSVFPTGGAANPTLTIVTLALRLADHIKERMA